MNCTPQNKGSSEALVHQLLSITKGSDSPPPAAVWAPAEVQVLMMGMEHRRSGAQGEADDQQCPP